MHIKFSWMAVMNGYIIDMLCFIRKQGWKLRFHPKGCNWPFFLFLIFFSSCLWKFRNINKNLPPKMVTFKNKCWNNYTEHNWLVRVLQRFGLALAPLGIEWPVFAFYIQLVLSFRTLLLLSRKWALIVTSICKKVKLQFLQIIPNQQSEYKTSLY